MGALLPLTVLLSTLSFIGAFDIPSVLNHSDCSTFSALITGTGVIKSYLTVEKGRGGLTLFAPSDNAFKDQGSPDLSKLKNAELVSLLHYHALPIYAPKETLKNMTKDHIKTLASNLIGNFELTVRIDGGGNLTVETGINAGRIVAVAGDEAPVCVFVLDRILLPVEIYGNATVIYGNATVPGPAQAPDGPEAKAPAPKKNSAGDVEAAGVIRAVFVAISVIAMGFFF